MAAVALELLLTLPPRSRLVWSAGDQDQAALALDAIGGFVQRTGYLSGLVEVGVRRALAVERGSSLVPLAADASSAWGLKPSFVAVDEFAQHPDVTNARRLWEALSSAVLKVPGARLAVMTTAGSPSHFSYGVLEHARSSPLWRVSETPGPPPWAPADRLEEQRQRLPAGVFEQLIIEPLG